MQQAMADLLQHAAFASVRTRHLLTISLELPPPVDVGTTPNGHRRAGLLTGGTVRGDRVTGTVLPGGNDWQLIRPDGSVGLDVRLVFRCDTGALVTMSYRGLRHGPPEVMQRMERGEAVDPGSYYFRIAPLFETADTDLLWLNGIVAIGIGHRLSGMPIYNVFEVL
jgi:Protein of unknown function (DUF3237)